MFAVLISVSKLGIMVVLPLPILATGGGGSVEILVSFFVSVGASIVGYYVSKWLDRHSRGK